MPVYSYSRLNTFETCPLQYKFKYIDKIKTTEEGIEAFLGQRFHEVMEKLYKDLPFKTDSLEELLAYYDTQWDKEFHDAIVIARENRTADDYRGLGRKFIEDYYKRYHPFTQSRVLGLERQVLVDLDGSGRYRLMGYIDRLALAEDGAYEIHDYKTSNSLPEQNKLDEDRQLALYQIAVERMWSNVREVRLVWHFVAFDKEMTSVRTCEQLDSVKTEAMRLIDEIEGIEESGFEPRESILCDWCGFREYCPLKKHSAALENLPPNEYLKDDGVKLVNAYADLEAKRKELKKRVGEIDEELEKIKEAAVAYSRREGAKVLKGSGHLLKIFDKQQVSSPGKGSPARTEFEKILRDAGVWEDVASLDPYALARAVNEKKWNAGLIDRIKPYLTIEKKYTVALSKIKDEE